MSSLKEIGSALFTLMLFPFAGCLGALDIKLEPVCGGLDRPLFVTHDGTTDALYIVEQTGRVRIFKDGALRPEPVLAIEPRVRFGGECGLLGLALHPRYAENGRLFVNYTTRTPDGTHTIVSEFRVDPKTGTADSSKEKVLMSFKQPWNNHNGGCLMFAPDGTLVIGTGDGGSGGDPLNSSQDLKTPLGKLLRIDVDQGNPYGIPADNPFRNNPEAMPEIWAYGLRNPWRFSFDRETGHCYAGDVGQGSFEEIDLVERGKNYGWSAREGFAPFKPERGGPNMVDPIKVYPRELGASVTGGYVYRGKRIPELQGVYLYADYASGRIWGLRWEDGKLGMDQELMDTDLSISSFGEDRDGELYICIFQRGEVLRIVD